MDMQTDTQEDGQKDKQKIDGLGPALVLWSTPVYSVFTVLRAFLVQMLVKE